MLAAFLQLIATWRNKTCGSMINLEQSAGSGEAKGKRGYEYCTAAPGFEHQLSIRNFTLLNKLVLDALKLLARSTFASLFRSLPRLLRHAGNERKKESKQAIPLLLLRPLLECIYGG